MLAIASLESYILDISLLWRKLEHLQRRCSVFCITGLLPPWRRYWWEAAKTPGPAPPRTMGCAAEQATGPVRWTERKLRTCRVRILTEKQLKCAGAKYLNHTQNTLSTNTKHQNVLNAADLLHFQPQWKTLLRFFSRVRPGCWAGRGLQSTPREMDADCRRCWWQTHAGPPEMSCAGCPGNCCCYSNLSAGESLPLSSCFTWIISFGHIKWCSAWGLGAAGGSPDRKIPEQSPIFITLQWIKT